ncbi:MAG: hypothetical protein JSS02_03840, partial [Planctomycetes bacterium]|nr:hypothetical protein [Planctomycetota bacterium]
GMISVPAAGSPEAWARAQTAGERALTREKMVALTVNRSDCAAGIVGLIETWRAAIPGVVVLPVYCSAGERNVASKSSYPRVVFGDPLPPAVTLEAIIAAVNSLADTPLDAE